MDEHHIYSRSLGGSNTKSNLTYICPNCHRRVHRGDLILEGKFFDGYGLTLVWRNKGETSVTGVIDPPVYLYGKEKG